jgi:hypothetical protein
LIQIDGAPVGYHRCAAKPTEAVFLDPASTVHHERDNGADEKHDEENLGDTGGAGGDATKAENRGYECDD